MCYIIENSLDRCQRLDCPITKLVMDAETNLEVMAGTVAKLGNELEQVQRERDVFEQRLQTTEQQFRWAQDRLSTLKASISNVEDVWREQVQGCMGDWTEDTLLQVIAEEFEFQATEEVEITVTMSQTVIVKKPIGTELSVQDFWMQKDTELLECNYEIISEESAEVEDISE